MLTTVVDALRALPVLWFGPDRTPDPRTLSHKAFVMELTTLDSKIFAWVDELQTHTSFDDARTKINLHYDLGLSDAECQALLHTCETHFAISFSKFERRHLLKRGVQVGLLHSFSKYAARRRDTYAAP